MLYFVLGDLGPHHLRFLEKGAVKVIQGLQRKTEIDSPVALTIGNFDGMHLGHQELIKRVVDRAKAEKLQGGLMTFDPHPLKILAPQRNFKMLFPQEDRIKMAETLGLDFIVVEPFSRALSELSPEDFFENILVSRLDLRHLFVGHDFSFGRNRAGTLDVLTELCRKNKISLDILDPVKKNGVIISSSQIRDAVSAGEMEKANSFLGRAFYLNGVVEKGRGRGRTIGFPTANLFTSAELLPRMGVYATRIEVEKRSYRSVTNVGKNPTFEEKMRHPVQVETFIMNFDKDIYGNNVKIEFLKFLRSELKFDSVNDLVSAIKQDVKNAEAIDWNSSSSN